MSQSKVGAQFVGQLYDVRTKRDGGGRIQIDFGADGLSEIQWIQSVAAKSRSGCNFQVALIPLPHDTMMSHRDEEFESDENGEIQIMGSD